MSFEFHRSKSTQIPPRISWKNELMLLRIANSGYYYLINWLSEDGYSTPIWAVLIAGSFVVVTLTLSIYLMFEHLSAYKNPEVQFRRFLIVWFCFFFPLEVLLLDDLMVFFFLWLQEQKFLIGVVLMVPCYGVESVRLRFFYMFELDWGDSYEWSWFL